MKKNIISMANFRIILLSQVDILVPILSRFFFCWKILPDSFLSGSSAKSLSIDNRTREGFLIELQVGHLSFFLISLYIHVRVYIYEWIATFWYDWDFNCISPIIFVLLNRFRPIFYMLLVSERPTATQNFSSLAPTVAELWGLHCQKIIFYMEMYWEKDIF